MRIITTAALLAGCTTSVVAWGAAGHEIAATIAQIHLHPSVFPNMCAVLNFTSTNPNEPQCHLAPVAAWADKLRYKMRWSAPLHYVGAVGDHPSQTCAFPGTRGWEGKQNGNVLGAIRNVTTILEDSVYYRETGKTSASQYDAANEALKFLIHFMGDLHMPLHLTGRDRGGNSNKVRFSNRQTNLHSVWDGLLIAKALRSVPRKYSQPLPSPKIEYALRGTIYDSYVRMIMWEGVLGKWEHDIPTWLTCPAPTGTRSVSFAFPSSFGAFWRQAQLVWNRVMGGTMDTDDDLICPYYWAQPIHALNCEIVWPKALDEPPYNNTRLDGASSEHSHHEFVSPDTELAQVDSAGRFVAGPVGGPYLELDTPEYSGVISKQWIVEKLLAQAGIRLAGVLNYLFADIEDPEEAKLWSRGLRIDF
ncbi:phospholipase C/P1 nuclease domain-containing protein [Mycena albidolilacea]|uniref:Phospholipase C/P1 nuclease domain-containing protein n=1 Tax=Mycena albidolilacea TaxID=1033008 RepID=A0AAD7AC59_9AGAR|nr:phospholipase C/P1 nuclease domain-containing protein [Mycena albidolilacea]